MPQPIVARGMRTFVIIWIGQLVSILGSSLSSFALFLILNRLNTLSLSFLCCCSCFSGGLLTSFLLLL